MDTAGFILGNPYYPNHAYAEQVRKWATAPIDEWRWHHFYFPDDSSDTGSDVPYSQWAPNITQAAQWCADHGTNMVLGSFGSPYTGDDVDMLPYQIKEMELIASDNRISEAVWWSYDNEDPHHLVT